MGIESRGRQEADAWPLEELLHPGLDFRAIVDERKNVTTIKLEYATSTDKILFWPHHNFLPWLQIVPLLEAVYTYERRGVNIGGNGDYKKPTPGLSMSFFIRVLTSARL